MFNFVLVLNYFWSLIWSTFLIYQFLKMVNALFWCCRLSLSWIHLLYFLPLASACFLPFIVSQHGFDPGLINYSLPEAFSVETIAPQIEPRFKYRYIRWRNKLRPDWHLLTLNFFCGLPKMRNVLKCTPSLLQIILSCARVSKNLRFLEPKCKALIL